MKIQTRTSKTAASLTPDAKRGMVKSVQPATLRDIPREIPSSLDITTRFGHKISEIPVSPPSESSVFPVSMTPQMSVANHITQRIRSAVTEGQSLDASVQHGLEEQLGINLSAVRVHTGNEADSLARSLDAIAFTTGPDIFFRSGAYHPASSSGLHLLAHEVMHTVQQAAGPVDGEPSAAGLSVSTPGDRFERAAEEAATWATSGVFASASAMPHQPFSLIEKGSPAIAGRSHMSAHNRSHPLAIQRTTPLAKIVGEKEVGKYKVGEWIPVYRSGGWHVSVFPRKGYKGRLEFDEFHASEERQEIGKRNKHFFYLDTGHIKQNDLNNVAFADKRWAKANELAARFYQQFLGLQVTEEMLNNQTTGLVKGQSPSKQKIMTVEEYRRQQEKLQQEKPKTLTTGLPSEVEDIDIFADLPSSNAPQKEEEEKVETTKSTTGGFLGLFADLPPPRAQTKQAEEKVETTKSITDEPFNPFADLPPLLSKKAEQKQVGETVETTKSTTDESFNPFANLPPPSQAVQSNLQQSVATTVAPVSLNPLKKRKKREDEN